MLPRSFHSHKLPPLLLLLGVLKSPGIGQVYLKSRKIEMFLSSVFTVPSLNRKPTEALQAANINTGVS